jgi:hypothetical protein
MRKIFLGRTTGKQARGQYHHRLSCHFYRTPGRAGVVRRGASPGPGLHPAPGSGADPAGASVRRTDRCGVRRHRPHDGADIIQVVRHRRFVRTSIGAPQLVGGTASLPGTHVTLNRSPRRMPFWELPTPAPADRRNVIGSGTANVHESPSAGSASRV